MYEYVVPEVVKGGGFSSKSAGTSLCIHLLGWISDAFDTSQIAPIIT